MKILLVVLIVAFVVWAAYMIVNMLRKRKATETTEQARIRQQVSVDLHNYTPSKDRYVPQVYSTPKAKPVTKTYEMKSQKNRDADNDSGSVDFGYWDTDGGAVRYSDPSPSYYESPQDEAPSSG
jgi:hypothetical protein